MGLPLRVVTGCDEAFRARRGSPGQEAGAGEGDGLGQEALLMACGLWRSVLICFCIRVKDVRRGSVPSEEAMNLGSAGWACSASCGLSAARPCAPRRSCSGASRSRTSPSERGSGGKEMRRPELIPAGAPYPSGLGPNLRIGCPTGLRCLVLFHPAVR